ncbi:MAG TPA: hypothetical protein VJ792_04265 [Candidatus Nitrosotalea sp.]|nr:hypothetical protein [Candidatus Nitrosotalea sp.]
MQTRHWMAIVMGAISSVQTAIGTYEHVAPEVVNYIVTNGLPASIAIADWINARLKEWSSVKDAGSALTAVMQLKDSIPQLQDAINKAPGLQALINKVLAKL